VRGQCRQERCSRSCCDVPTFACSNYAHGAVACTCAGPSRSVVQSIMQSCLLQPHAHHSSTQAGTAADGMQASRAQQQHVMALWC
jgi:hypothetical protein